MSEATRPAPNANMNQPRGKKNLPPNVIWLSLASMFNDISSEIATRVLPLFLAGVLGVSYTIIGVIEGIADTTATLINIFSGWYSDRWGKRKVIAGTGYALSC